MQRRQRRISSRQRNPRAARNPAYQIKPRYHLAPESPDEGHTETWEVEPEQLDDDSQWQRPGAVDVQESEDTEGTEDTAKNPS